jgi:hypothetical protein
MKVKMYADLYPGLDPREHMTASAYMHRAPSQGVIRVAFLVDIPERICRMLDYVEEELPEIPTAEVVADNRMPRDD